MCLHQPVIDFENLNNQEEIQNTICDIVSMLYSTDRTDPPIKPLQKTCTGIFLTERRQVLPPIHSASHSIGARC